jgi:hypothetical protein
MKKDTKSFSRVSLTFGDFKALVALLIHSMPVEGHLRTRLTLRERSRESEYASLEEAGADSSLTGPITGFSLRLSRVRAYGDSHSVWIYVYSKLGATVESNDPEWVRSEVAIIEQYFQGKEHKLPRPI